MRLSCAQTHALHPLTSIVHAYAHTPCHSHPCTYPPTHSLYPLTRTRLAILSHAHVPTHLPIHPTHLLARAHASAPAHASCHYSHPRTCSPTLLVQSAMSPLAASPSATPWLRAWTTGTVIYARTCISGTGPDLGRYSLTGMGVFHVSIHSSMRLFTRALRGGAVFAEGTTGLSVSHCHFDRLGGNGLFLSIFNEDSRVSDSEFSWLGDSGVAMLGHTKFATTGDMVRLSFFVLLYLAISTKQKSKPVSNNVQTKPLIRTALI